MTIRVPVVTGVAGGGGIPDDYHDWEITGFRDVTAVGGDDSLVMDEHKAVYFEVFQAIGESRIPVSYRTYSLRLDQIETEKKALTARTATIKKEFATMLREGI